MPVFWEFKSGFSNEFDGVSLDYSNACEVEVKYLVDSLDCYVKISSKVEASASLLPDAWILPSFDW